MNPRRRRLVVSVATLAAVVAFAFAGLGLRAPSGNAATTSLDVAVLSPRRVPDVLNSLVAQTRLSSRVAVFTRSLGPTSCLAVSVGKASVFTRNPDLALTPASALKLTTAAAVLGELGGTERFTTAVRGPAPRAGVVDGDVALVGGGDPLLATDGYVTTRRHPPKPATQIAALAKALKDRGVNRITGRVLVVDSRYDAERRVPTWSAGYTSNGDVGPLGALAVNDGFASYAPLIASTDPAVAAGTALRDALVAAGVTVDGGVARGTASGAEIARVQSAPYAQVVTEMLTESDNNTAELLLKELAYAAGTKPSTRSAGVAARNAALRKLGVKADAVAAIDGSGLDRSDKATCAALLATLLAKPGGYDLDEMLAVAGETGTLNDRFLDSPLKGALRAKTGTLNDVTALVGVANPALPEPVRFAFIANGSFSDAGGKALQDRLVNALATYPEAPGGDKLAP